MSDDKLTLAFEKFLN